MKQDQITQVAECWCYDCKKVSKYINCGTSRYWYPCQWCGKKLNLVDNAVEYSFDFQPDRRKIILHIRPVNRPPVGDNGK